MLEHKYPRAAQILANDLKQHSRIKIQQLTKRADLIGEYHYRMTSKDIYLIAYATEQLRDSKIKRIFLNLRRSFDIHLYNNQDEHLLTLRHPFRWFYNRLEIYDPSGEKRGTVKQAFTLLPYFFNVENSNGKVLYKFSSPYVEYPTTFTVTYRKRDIAIIHKDRFATSYELLFQNVSIDIEDRLLILVGALFADLYYF